MGMHIEEHVQSRIFFQRAGTLRQGNVDLELRCDATIVQLTSPDRIVGAYRFADQQYASGGNCVASALRGSVQYRGMAIFDTKPEDAGVICLLT